MRIGLQADSVAIDGALRHERRRCRRFRRMPPPGRAIEFIEHGTAPIALRGGRRRAEEVHAKRDLIGQREIRDVARTQGVAEAGVCALAGIVEAP